MSSLSNSKIYDVLNNICTRSGYDFKEMNYVDLFAGGMSIGFKRAGYNHIFANEIDKHASSTLSKNNPKDKVITCSIERLVKKLGITNIIKIILKTQLIQNKKQYV